MDKNTQKKLEELLGNFIDKKELAISLRRFSLETIRLVLADKEETLNKDWIAVGHYWINEICEILDPQLEK